jgi:hypothetical protein
VNEGCEFGTEDAEDRELDENGAKTCSLDLCWYVSAISVCDVKPACMITTPLVVVVRKKRREFCARAR